MELLAEIEERVKTAQSIDNLMPTQKYSHLVAPPVSECVCEGVNVISAVKCFEESLKSLKTVNALYPASLILTSCEL